MQNQAAHRIHVSTMGDYLLASADRWPDRDLLIFPDARCTYQGFVDDALRYARSMLGLGIEPGDAVGILMPNCMDYLKLLLAANFVGAMAVPMNARYRAAELAYVVENADLKLLLTNDLISEYADFGDLLTEAFPQLADAGQPLQLEFAPKLQHVVMFGAAPGGFMSGQAFHDAGLTVSIDDVHAARVRVRVEQPAIMMYTSGTTANPKGCPLSHALLVRNGVNMNRERYFLTETDVFWAPLPMFHMSAILPFLCCTAGCLAR